MRSESRVRSPHDRTRGLFEKVHVAGREVQVRHEPQDLRPHRHHMDPPLTERRRDLSRAEPVTLDRDHGDVGGHRLRICGEPIDAAEPLGDLAGQGVIHSEPLHVFCEGHPRRRRQQPIQPPSRFRTCMPRSTKAASPATTDPTGAPSPLERQSDTESAWAVHSGAATPEATTAFASRAPSRCTGTPRSLATREMEEISSMGTTTPPATLWVCSRQTSAVFGQWMKSGRMASSTSAAAMRPSRPPSVRDWSP